jgi:hypothetical protein
MNFLIPSQSLIELVLSQVPNFVFFSFCSSYKIVHWTEDRILDI